MNEKDLKNRHRQTPKQQTNTAKFFTWAAFCLPQEVLHLQWFLLE